MLICELELKITDAAQTTTYVSIRRVSFVFGNDERSKIFLKTKKKIAVMLVISIIAFDIGIKNTSRTNDVKIILSNIETALSLSSLFIIIHP